MSDLTKQERENNQKGLILSVVIHTLLLALLAFSFMKWQDPPPEPGGIAVNLGIPDVGMNDNKPVQAAASKPAEPEPVKETKPEPEPKPEKKKTTTKPTPKPKVKKTEDPNAARIEEEKRRQRQLEKEKREREAEAERQRQREAEAAAAAAAAEQKKQDDLAASIGGAVKNSGGSGDKPGTPGVEDGTPGADKLKGKNYGSGTVGGAIGNRVGRRGPTIVDNSQAEGTVVVRVCIDKTGRITEATYTQSGSSTSNSTLKRLAIENAKKWKFSAGSVDKQCGTITYNFKLK